MRETVVLRATALLSALLAATLLTAGGTALAADGSSAERLGASGAGGDGGAGKAGSGGAGGDKAGSAGSGGTPAPLTCEESCDRTAAVCVDACEETHKGKPMPRVQCKLACADKRTTCVQKCSK